MQNRRFSILLLISLGGCSYSVFSDLADQAPVGKVTQEGTIQSTSYGDHLVGLSREASQTGGLLAISGNNAVSLTTVTVSESGEITPFFAPLEDIKAELDNPDKVYSMAPAPLGLLSGSNRGPYFYIGSSSGSSYTVRVMDWGTLKNIKTYKAPTSSYIEEFGLSVVAAQLDKSSVQNDLAVGAKKSLALFRALGDSGERWPEMGEPLAIVTDESFEGASFRVLAAGDLDATAGDEIVMADPEKNKVVIVHHIADCSLDANKTCNDVKFFTIEAPEGSIKFGWSLLIADLDGDNNQELAVGDTGAERVYVYSFKGLIFDENAPKSLAKPIVLEGGSGAKGFGKSLAYGKVDGVESYLVVGAPTADAGGITGAGEIFLFDSALKKHAEPIALFAPEQNDLLGQHLGILPFRAKGQLNDVLIASGRDAVFVFFANLTQEHHDVRTR